MLKQSQTILATQELKPGMVIVRVVQQNGPVKIKKSGLVTSQEMVQGLIEMGIQQVEIDPHQTVEIDAEQPPEIKKSATRRMLESDGLANNRKDDGVSEQFHRSLFLPSVQDLPSAWQYHAKRYVQAGLIAVGGFALGLTLFNYQTVLSLVTFNSTPLMVEQKSVPATVPDAIPAKAQPEPISEENQGTAQPQQTPKSEVVAQVEADPIVVPVEPVESKIIKQVEPEDVKDTPNISAELINKFNQAIAQVSEEPASDDHRQIQQETADVLRVDQLPAWILTTLPSMSFSAHMYASEPSERWVRVNGTKMIEGDVIADKVQIMRIEPQQVILEYSGQEFSMAALTDW